MPVRKAKAEWRGNLAEGRGTVSTGSGAIRDAAYSFSSRFESGEGTNPDELIGAALAGCFAMALSNGLARAGHAPERTSVEASVHLEKGEEGFSITKVALHCEAAVPGIDQAAFEKEVETAKNGCPVSRALGAITIEVDARLLS
jgi:lipoyl-dependent peroxiredoxin